MRILTNFTKKVNTGAYENETYAVTFEAITEFNNANQIADYLFLQAREAVKRQLDGTAAKEFSFSVPTVSVHTEETDDEIVDLDKEEVAQKVETPVAEKQEEKVQAPASAEPQKPAVKKSTNGNKKQEAVTQPSFPDASGNNGSEKNDAPFLLITDKQIKMLFRLSRELGYDKNDVVGYLKEEAGKLNPSSCVEHLNQIPRKIASRLIQKLLDIQREVAA